MLCKLLCGTRTVMKGLRLGATRSSSSARRAGQATRCLPCGRRGPFHDGPLASQRWRALDLGESEATSDSMTHRVPFRMMFGTGAGMGHSSPKHAAGFKRGVQPYRESGTICAEIDRGLGVDSGSISD